MPLPTNTSTGSDINILDPDQPDSGRIDASSYPSIAEFAGDIRYIDFVPVSQRKAGVPSLPGAYPVAYLGFTESAAVPSYALLLAENAEDARVATSVLEWFAFLNSGNIAAQNDISYILGHLARLAAMSDEMTEDDVTRIATVQQTILRRIEKTH